MHLLCPEITIKCKCYTAATLISVLADMDSHNTAKAQIQRL